MINDFRGGYRFLSNFWSCYIEDDLGTMYPSVENTFQAMKMKYLEDRQKFLFCKASEAKQLGRIFPQRDDWKEPFPIEKINPFQDKYCALSLMTSEEIAQGCQLQTRIVVMFNLVKQKFEKNKILADLLLQTWPHQLEEGNWWGDDFWGTVNGKGENWLGKILMLVRHGLYSLRETE